MGDPLLDVFLILFIGLPMAAFARWKKRGYVFIIIFFTSIYAGTIYGNYHEIVVLAAGISLIGLFFLPYQCPKCKSKIKRKNMKAGHCDNCGPVELRKAWMFLFFLVVVFLLLPAQIIFRKNMIQNEGEKIIELIENHKITYKTCPHNLEKLNVGFRYKPRYIKNDNQNFILVYKVFGFLRWSYDSKSKKWSSID